MSALSFNFYPKGESNGCRSYYTIAQGLLDILKLIPIFVDQKSAGGLFYK
jgi:hypothetical protein